MTFTGGLGLILGSNLKSGFSSNGDKIPDFKPSCDNAKSRYFHAHGQFRPIMENEVKTAIVAVVLATAIASPSNAGDAAYAQSAEPRPGRGESSHCWQWLPDDEYHMFICSRTPAYQSFVRGTNDDKIDTAIGRDAALRHSWSYQYPSTTRTYYYSYRARSSSTYYRFR
jgi:hypothetical protein